MAASNRRSFFRQPMLLRISLRVSGVRAPVAATLVDLSGGGGMVTARTMLKHHSPVEFDLPREGMPHLRLAGKIRKVNFIPGERTFKYAVEFEGQTEEEREALLRFIIEEQRRSISVAKRGDEEPQKAKPSTRLQEQRAHRRIDVNIPVRISIRDVPSVMEAVAIDVSTGGARILIEHVLRQEWLVTLRFTLPSDVLRGHERRTPGRHGSPFEEIKIDARALPGVKQQRGKYIQSLVWVHPDPALTAEINRFVQASQLASLRRA